MTNEPRVAAFLNSESRAVMNNEPKVSCYGEQELLEKSMPEQSSLEPIINDNEINDELLQNDNENQENPENPVKIDLNVVVDTPVNS